MRLFWFIVYSVMIFTLGQMYERVECKSHWEDYAMGRIIHYTPSQCEAEHDQLAYAEEQAKIALVVAKRCLKEM